MGRRTDHDIRYANTGRPTIMTPDVLTKLEEAFLLGLSDLEACFLANINPRTLYKYQVANPDFIQRKHELKLHPTILAKKTIVASLDKDLNSAWRWAEKKDPELKPVLKTEMSGTLSVKNEAPSEAIQEAIKVYEETRDKQIKEETKLMP